METQQYAEMQQVVRCFFELRVCCCHGDGAMIFTRTFQPVGDHQRQAEMCR